MKVDSRVMGIVASVLAASCGPALAPASPAGARPGDAPGGTPALPVVTVDIAAPPAPTAAPPPSAPPPTLVVADDLATAPLPELEPAAASIRDGKWSRARTELVGAVKLLGPHGALDSVLVAHALLGRTCAHLGDATCAAAEFQAVMELWASPGDAAKRLDALGGDDAAKRRRVDRAILAVGEALFFAAERTRQDADRIARPIYRGAGSRDEVLAFVQEKLAAWVKAKRRALDEADQAYTKIVRIEPAPPARWVVAAGARVGAMWAGFVEEFRSAPMPKEWMGTGTVPGTTDLTYEELRRTYKDKLVEASEPQLDAARAAFQRCSEVARRFRIADEHARACDAWLSAHAKP